MKKSAHSLRSGAGRLSTLCLALGAVLSIMASAQARAMIVDTIETTPLRWESGGITIRDTGELRTEPTAKRRESIFIDVDRSVEELRNKGIIDGRKGSGIVSSAGSAIKTIGNNGYIMGPDELANGWAIDIGGNLDTLLNTGHILGNIHNSEGASIRSFRNGGQIAGERSDGRFINDGTIGNFSNGSKGRISAHLDNRREIGQLDNHGVMIGGIGNSGNIGEIGNYSVMSGGIDNRGEIGKIDNRGAIRNGVVNNGSIVSFENEGNITGNSEIGGDGAYGVSGSGMIATLNNNGTILGIRVGTRAGVGGRIGELNNLDKISAPNTNNVNNAAIHVGSGAGIGMLNNGGKISANIGVKNDGVIEAFKNTGVIQGKKYAFFNASTGMLNTAIANEGTIAGQMHNDAHSDLRINGAGEDAFGLITGFSGGTGKADIGLITNTASDVVFGSGNQLLNANIVAVGSQVVNAAGVLQVNHPISIDGNYRQNAEGALNLGIGSNAREIDYGRLLVSGSVNIDSGSSVNLKALNNYGFAQGQRFIVVKAQGTNIHYNEGSLRYSASGYDGVIIGKHVVDGDAGTRDLVLILGGSGPDPFRPINRATIRNAESTLDGLFRYEGENAELLDVFDPAAAFESSAAANRGGLQLSPSANADAAVRASLAAGERVTRRALTHLDELRSTGGGGDEVLWGQVFDGQSSQQQREELSGHRARYSGVLMGADAAIGERWRAGGLLSHVKTSVSSHDDNAGSSTVVNSYGLTGYAGYTGDSWYANLAASVAHQQYTGLRAIDFTGFSGKANSRYQGAQYTAAAQAGYPLSLGAYTVTPLAGLVYGAVGQNGFTETGGSGAALHVKDTQTTSLKSDLGARLECSFETAVGTLAPMAQLTWRREYNNARLRSEACFAKDASAASRFVTEAAAPVRDLGVLSLGLTLARTINLSLSATYMLEAGSGYASQTGDIRVRWLF